MLSTASVKILNLQIELYHFTINLLPKFRSRNLGLSRPKTQTVYMMYETTP